MSLQGSLLAALVLFAVACSSNGPVHISKEQAAPLMAAIHQQQALESGRTAAEPKPGTTPKAHAPASVAEREARATRVFPKARRPSSMVTAGPDSPYMVAFFSALPGAHPAAEPALALVDVSTEPASLVGWHDFGGEESGASAQPTSLDAPLLLEGEGGHPIALAQLRDRERGVVGLCGWSLDPARPRFVCAPKLPGPSEYRRHGEALIETWHNDFPPAGVHPPTLSGRIFRLEPSGRWTEVDQFRCLGRPLDEVLKEAGREELHTWQRNLGSRLIRTAILASEQLETAHAVERLRAAIEVDACEAETWRLLGRLDFESGKSAAAVPSLAVAVALSPREPAAFVDLGDALAALDQDDAASAKAFEDARQVLLDKPSTRELADGATTPVELARRLYRSYLVQTEPAAEHHRARRRRVEEQLQRLH